MPSSWRFANNTSTQISGVETVLGRCDSSRDLAGRLADAGADWLRCRGCWFRKWVIAWNVEVTFVFET